MSFVLFGIYGAAASQLLFDAGTLGFGGLKKKGL